MLCARAKSAQKKRKLVAFLSILVIGGLIPAMAHANTTGDQQDAAQDSPAKYLSLSEALSVIPDLQISVLHDNANRSAKLTGLVPEKCASNITLASTTLDASMTDSAAKQLNGADQSAGFAIHDNGGLLTCIQKQNKAGNSCSNTTDVNHCLSLSQIGSAAAIPLPANETVAVSYLNKVNGDAALNDNWNAVNLGSKPLISYSAAYLQAVKDKAEADEKAKEAAALQAAILQCAQTRDGIDDARDSLASSGLDQGTIADLTTKIDSYQKKFDAQDLKGLQTRVKLAIDQNKSDQFDALEEQIYDYYGNHSDSGNQLAQMIYDMANARANSDSPTNEDLDKAEATLNRALDPDSGLNLSDKNQHTFELALRNFPNLRVQVAARACDEAGANLQFTQMQGSRGMNPYTAMRSMNGMMKQEQSACRQANKLYDAQVKLLNKQLKANHCSAVDSSGPLLLFGGTSGHESSSSSGACQQINDQISALQNGVQSVSNDVNQEAQQAMQSMMPRQPMQPQQGPQSPMVSPNTTFGPPAPMFSNPMMPGYAPRTPTMYSGQNNYAYNPATTPATQFGTPVVASPYYSGYYYQQRPPMPGQS